MMDTNIINLENAIIIWLIRNYNDYFEFSILKRDLFKEPRNKAIYSKMQELANKKEEWNMITFAMDSKLTSYILALDVASDLICSKEQIKTYIDKLFNDYTLNRIQTETKNLIETLSPSNADEIKQKIISSFEFRVETEKTIQDYLNELDLYIQNPIRRLKTPFKELNEALGGGWFCGGVHTIAGRPGQGKTSMITSLIVNDLSLNRKVGFISLEMTSNELLLRIISNIAKVPVWNIENSKMTNEQIKSFSKVFIDLSKETLCLCDNSILNPIQIYNKITKWVQEQGIEIVYIDQLSNINHEKAENKTNAIERSMFWIKASAKYNKIPIILAHQLNRDIDNRPDKTNFSLSDLKDSSSIEADSYTVSFLVRPETYLKPNEQYRGQSAKGLGIFKMLKNRGGTLSEINLKFEGEIYTFSDTSDFHFTKNDINAF